MSCIYRGLVSHSLCLFHPSPLFISFLLPFKTQLLIRLGARARGYIQNSFRKWGEEVGSLLYHFPFHHQYSLTPCNLYSFLCQPYFFFTSVVLSITPHNIWNVSALPYLRKNRAVQSSIQFIYCYMLQKKKNQTQNFRLNMSPYAAKCSGRVEFPFLYFRSVRRYKDWVGSVKSFVTNLLIKFINIFSCMDIGNVKLLFCPMKKFPAIF